jgi:ribonuclease D
MGEGQIQERVVNQPADLAECCDYLSSCRQFGFDTEFVGEETYHPRLCLVQVATLEQLILIDPLSAGPLDAFWKLVVDPAHEVIVHGGREEIRLCRLWAGVPPANLFDVQLAAGLVGFAYPLGHATLVSQVIGVQMAKGETLTEWRDRPLTRQQIQYAFDDVRYLLPVWQRLSDRLREEKRVDWARDEFQRLGATASPEEGPSEKWRKLRGLGSLDRRRLAMVREMFSWREETAARTNRPARTIVRDDLLIEIARRNPARERDLHVIRGLPRRGLSAVMEAVERARALPIEQCPVAAGREIDPPQVGFVTSVLMAALGDYCARQRLAGNLVASTEDVRLLVRARFKGRELPEDSLLTQGWRREHILPYLQSFLDGKRSLRIADVRAEAPFDCPPL